MKWVIHFQRFMLNNVIWLANSHASRVANVRAAAVCPQWTGWCNVFFERTQRIPQWIGCRSNPYWIGIGVRSGPSCDFQLKWSLCYFAVLVLHIECRSDCTFAWFGSFPRKVLDLRVWLRPNGSSGLAGNCPQFLLLYCRRSSCYMIRSFFKKLLASENFLGTPLGERWNSSWLIVPTGTNFGLVPRSEPMRMHGTRRFVCRRPA